MKTIFRISHSMKPSLLLARMSLLLLFASFSRPLLAQDLNCETDPEACLAYRVELPIYCREGIEGTFALGIDPDNFDILFEANFPSLAPAKKLQFYAVDGNIGPGLGAKLKVATLLCEGSRCRATISPELAQSLEAKFDFDQAVINVSLRQGKKDLCLGKLTNNPEKIEESGALARNLCRFTPFENNNLSGEGFFDPFGFGSEDEGLFHMSLYGFEPRTKIQACKLSGQRYRSFLSFQTASPLEGDQEIYGKKLSAEESARLESRPDLYSYDFIRSLVAPESEDVGAALSKDLSAVFNKTIGAGSASKAMKQATKSRRDRKREKRKTSQRREFLVETAGAGDLGLRSKSVGAFAKKRQEPQDVFGWLQMDPSFGSFYLAPTCRGDVPEKAFGILSCDERAGSSCFDIVAGNASLGTARACLESREGYRLLTVRLLSGAQTEYQICLNGNLESQGRLLNKGRYFERVLSNNSALAERVDDIGLAAADLSALRSLALSSDADCASAEFQYGFSDE